MIEATLEYAKTLKNTPYLVWYEGMPIDKNPPFYAENKPIPSTKYIKVLTAIDLLFLFLFF